MKEYTDIHVYCLLTTHVGNSSVQVDLGLCSVQVGWALMSLH